MKRTRFVIAVVAIAALFAGGYLAWRYLDRRDALPEWIERSNGRIEMTRTDVAVKYPGRLVELLVHEGDSVRAGQIVAKQDAADVMAQLDGAKASRERALGALARAKGEHSAHQSQADLARLNWSETVNLHSRQMVSDVELKQRRLALSGAADAVAAAGGGISEARGALAQADAQIRQVSTVQEDLHIRAPAPGVVEYRIVEPGTMMAPGGKLISIVNTEDVYLTIFLPSGVASRVSIGDEARIVLQGTNKALPARVTFVSPEAQFTPKFVETANERDNLSYRVKLQISAEVARQYAGLLKAGMTAEGYVRTDRRRPWPDLASLHQ